MEQVPEGLGVHLVLGDCATHKVRGIKKWLPAHPRFHLHFTPTSASWLNLVEWWFAELTQKKLKRGAHRSVQALAPKKSTGRHARSNSKRIVDEISQIAHIERALWRYGNPTTKKELHGGVINSYPAPVHICCTF